MHVGIKGCARSLIHKDIGFKRYHLSQQKASVKSLCHTLSVSITTWWHFQIPIRKNGVIIPIPTKVANRVSKAIVYHSMFLSLRLVIIRVLLFKLNIRHIGQPGV